MRLRRRRLDSFLSCVVLFFVELIMREATRRFDGSPQICRRSSCGWINILLYYSVTAATFTRLNLNEMIVCCWVCDFFWTFLVESNSVTIVRQSMQSLFYSFFSASKLAKHRKTFFLFLFSHSWDSPIHFYAGRLKTLNQTSSQNWILIFFSFFLSQCTLEKVVSRYFFTL